MFRAEGELERAGRDAWWTGVFQVVAAFGAFDISYALYKYLAKSFAGTSGSAAEVLAGFIKDYSEAASEEDKVKIFQKWAPKLFSIPQTAAIFGALGNSGGTQVSLAPQGQVASYGQPLVLN